MVARASAGGAAGGSISFGWKIHKGILAYGTEEIHISGGKLIVKVRGAHLELRAMNAVELLITGDIVGVDLA